MSLVVAQSQTPYRLRGSSSPWIEVLVDCPGVEGTLTYRLPDNLSVTPGDILSVPLQNRTVGGIALGYVDTLAPSLTPDKIRPIEQVVARGLFPPHYWQLLERVARYYCTPLSAVVRTALPPGLFAQPRRRVRLQVDAVPEGAENFCSATAGQILQLLAGQKDGDYSLRYLQQQVRGARKAIAQLEARGWVESYLELPRHARPQRQKFVTAIAPTGELTPRQRQVLDILYRHGGELPLTQLLQLGGSSAVVNNLARQGCVSIEQREVLRLSKEAAVESDRPKALTPAQQEALSAITALDGFACVLLHGVTGSGKTEVYLQAIAPVLERGESALVLVPEIGLTPQLTDRFRARFPRVCVYHSALSDGERYDTWRQMLAGEAQVVIGTRSCVFAPLPKLGLVVLDEEHDSSFKQEQRHPTYHARTVARWRSQLADCPLVLGSATPALETWNEPEKLYLSLPERVRARPLPVVDIIDMRQELREGNRSIFSRTLAEAIASVQRQNQQGILFIPRRGHSTFVSCRSCGYVLECPHCDVSLAYHYTHAGARELLRCHYCNFTRTQPPQCPACGSPYFKHFGSGTQRVVQELELVLPGIRCLRFDSDTTRAKGAHRALLERFARKEADLLVGTQMLTKGLDLAGVTLVGVVAADGLLNRGDYRANERAFQTLTQVAGRAGRGDDRGRVIIQTYTPDSPTLEAVRTHDYERFAAMELPRRGSLNYPPYGRLVLLQLSGLDAMEVQQSAVAVSLACQERVASLGCEVLGPAPASIMRVARRYRWQILLKFTEMVETLPDLASLATLTPRGVTLALDIDPVDIH